MNNNTNTLNMYFYNLKDVVYILSVHIFKERIILFVSLNVIYILIYHRFRTYHVHINNINVMNNMVVELRYI